MPATGSPPTTPNSPAPTPQSPAPIKADRPAWLGEQYWDPDKASIKPDFETHYRELASFKAAEDSRKLTLPQKPEDLKLALPKDFKAPQGIEYVPNENDPLLPQARAFALKHGLSQAGFEELVGLHAAGQVSSQQNIATAKSAEVAKLGPNGTARKTAVDTWLTAELGADLGGEMSKFMFTAKQVEGIEKLMEKARTQGGGSFSHQGRDPGPAGKLSPEQYDRLSFHEKKEYARKFPQQQTTNGAQR